MSRDVEILRGLLLELEKQQRSPPEPIFLEIEVLARLHSKHPTDIFEALDLLVALDFVEGPGAYRDTWLFRKLTQRGAALTNAIRNPDDWLRVKAVYAPMMQSR